MDETSPENSNPRLEDSKNGNSPTAKTGALLAIVAGLIMIVIGVVTYNYFNNTTRIGKIDKGEVAPVKIDVDNDFEGILTGKEDVDFKTNPSNNVLNTENKNNDSVGILQKLKDKIFVEPESTENTVKIDDNTKVTQATDSTTAADTEKSDTSGISQPSNPPTSVTSTETIKRWRPNNYKQGDITSNNYVVKSGDTLWEIAEGFYGNGSEWVKIASANKIKNLPNGNPLIVPKQKLTLP